MTSKKFSEVFEEARDIVAAGRWIQENDVGYEKGQLCFCMRGAIKYADLGHDALKSRGDFVSMASNALEYAYEKIKLEEVWPDRRTGSGLAAYNDVRGRTKEEVADMLAKFRDLAIEEGK